MRWILLITLTFGLLLPAYALEPEPRIWNHLPVDSNFGGIAYVYTEMDYHVDPTFELEDVKMEMDSWVGKYIRTFELSGKTARFNITQAYQEADWNGLLQGRSASTSRSGWSDTFVRVAMNLYGAPALRGKEFGNYRAGVKKETIVGVALVLRLPTGSYYDDKVLNLGQNRFVFRPQLGVLHTHGKWGIELTGEVALYMENDSFFDGSTLEQEPLYIIHGHVIYTFRPGQWVTASAGYDYGGEYKLNGVAQDDAHQNIGVKLSYAHPVSRTTGIRLSYLGTRTREDIGYDAETLALSVSFAW